VRRHGTVETKFRQVQLVDEGIYDPDWIVLFDVVINTFGKQCNLLAVIALNESLHESPGLNALIQFRRSLRFHTASPARDTHKLPSGFGCICRYCVSLVLEMPKC
jgi:hypothetical protein